MARINPRDVTITPAFFVDCKVCNEGVEVDGAGTVRGAFLTREEAAESKRNHLEEHEAGEWG